MRLTNCNLPHMFERETMPGVGTALKQQSERRAPQPFRYRHHNLNRRTDEYQDTSLDAPETLHPGLARRLSFPPQQLVGTSDAQSSNMPAQAGLTLPRRSGLLQQTLVARRSVSTVVIGDQVDELDGGNADPHQVTRCDRALIGPAVR